MKFGIYSERDLKVGFGFPYCAPNDSYAARNFRIRCQEGIMAAAGQDFQLFKVGDFDVEVGTIEPCLPVLICDGGDVCNA